MIKILGEVPRSVKLVTITIYYNVTRRKESIERSLSSLCSLKMPPHLIVLVDNGSQDGTWQLLESLVSLRCKDKNVILIKLPKNLGFSRANNIAYSIVNRLIKEIDYVVLLNDDVIINRNFLKLLEIFEGMLDEVCGVQGLLLSGSKREWSVIDSSAHYIAPFVSLVGVLPSSSYPPLVIYPQFPGYLDGALSIYRHSCLQGKLFEPLCFMYGDDYELGTRLYSLGRVLVYVPLIVGTHTRGSTRRQRSRLREVISWWAGYCSGSHLLSIEGIPRVALTYLYMIRGCFAFLVDLITRIPFLARLFHITEGYSRGEYLPLSQGLLWALVEPARFVRRKAPIVAITPFEIFMSFVSTTVPKCYPCSMLLHRKKLRELFEVLISELKEFVRH